MKIATLSGPEPMSFEPGVPAPENFIPLCIPEIKGNEWKYVKECLNTGWVSSVGTFVDQFEKKMSGYMKSRHCVATINGTAALHIALLVAGVKIDDEVLVSTLTFIAPVNAIRYVGAWPVFMDADPDYWQMDPKKVSDFLNNECRWVKGELRNKTTGKRIKAILPVHILGHPVDMDPILEVARKYNLVVIEDASESLGAHYKDRMVGSLADIACFSFNGNKIITTGAGGMIVTDNEAWAHNARYLTTQAKDNPVEYIHNEIGYNYRLSNINAAMGCAQMEQLDDYLTAKRRIALTYNKALAEFPGIKPMTEAQWASSSFWLYTIMVDDKTYGMNSRVLLNELRKGGVQTRPLWQPIHLSKVYRRSQTYCIEVGEKLYQRSLSLPSSVGLQFEDLYRVIRLIDNRG